MGLLHSAPLTEHGEPVPSALQYVLVDRADTFPVDRTDLDRRQLHDAVGRRTCRPLCGTRQEIGDATCCTKRGELT